VIRDLKFTTADRAGMTMRRIGKLRDLLMAADHDRFPSATAADNHITTVLTRGGDTETAQGRNYASRFVPILAHDLREFPAGDFALWNGQQIRPGTLIRYETGELKEWRDARGKKRSRWIKTTHEATVRVVRQPHHAGPHKFAMTVDDWDAGQTRHNVLDAQVREVLPQTSNVAWQRPGVDLHGPDVRIDGKRATVGAIVATKYGAGGKFGRPTRVVGHLTDLHGERDAPARRRGRRAARARLGLRADDVPAQA
jgi:hypothetical protein